MFLPNQDANGGQIKRWVTSAAAMDRYEFDWARIKHRDVPLADLDPPDGPLICWP